MDENVLNKQQSPPLDLDSTKFVENNIRVKYQNLRLQEMESANSKLEKLVDQNQKELINVNESNWKYISIIAHDLRSPFSSIIGSLDLLKEKMKVHRIADVDNYLQIASDSATSTLELLDNLLAWTISQHKSTCINPHCIDLQKIVSFEIESALNAASIKKITLCLDIPDGLCVMADLQMVKTILRNLIGNAIKYANIGGEITINAKRKHEFVEITVKDNGIGFSKELQKEIFSINNANRSNPGTNNELGTGLGLVLCQEFIEIQGGTIRIESEMGNGSEIIFTLLRYIK
jgi:two-component system, sensor histidine kinase and response regulator